MDGFNKIMDFLLGSPPAGMEAINYTFRCIIGLVFFDALLDLFRIGKHFFGRR